MFGSPQIYHQLFAAFYRWGGSLEQRETELATIARQLGVGYDLLLERLNYAMDRAEQSRMIKHSILAYDDRQVGSPPRAIEHPTTIPILGSAMSRPGSAQSGSLGGKKDDGSEVYDEEEVTDGEDKVDDDHHVTDTDTTTKGDEDEEEKKEGHLPPAVALPLKLKKTDSLTKTGKRKDPIAGGSSSSPGQKKGEHPALEMDWCRVIKQLAQRIPESSPYCSEKAQEHTEAG